MSGSVLTDAASIAAIEITKVSSFINYLERNAPGLGEAASYTQEVTDGIKQQIQTTGSCAFATVFDQAKDIIPNLAMQGYAHAQGFTEYLVSSVPHVFSGGVGSLGLGIVDAIKTQAPGAFDTAFQLGGQTARLVADGGVAVFNQIKDAGGVMPFLQLVHPEILVSLAPTLAVNFESLGAIKEAGSGLKEATAAAVPVAKEAASGIIDGGKVVATAAAPLTSVIGSNLSDVANVVGSAASAAGNAIGSALSNVDTSDVAQGADLVLNALGSAAAIFPFLLPVQIALRDIGNAVQQATYNKEAAEMLKGRCADCAKLVAEMSPKIAKIAPTEDERVGMITPFVDAVNEASEFLKKFSSRNFIMHMITWKREGRSLQFVDKKITDTLQNLSLRVNGYQVDVQVNTNDKVEQIFAMLNNIDLNKVKEPKDIQPEKLVEMIKAAGAASTEEIKEQMEFIGVKIEEVMKAINALSENITNVTQTITVLSEQLTQQTKDNEAIKDALVGQKENNDFMKDFLIQSVSTFHRDNTLTLKEIKSLIERSGVAGAGHAAEVFSDTHKAMYLSMKANDVKEKTQNIILIHAHGINFQTFQSLNGDNGASGRSGPNVPMGRSGQPGNVNMGHLDGADGEDGEDGQDGEHGEDGESGQHAGDFEVMIIFVKENKQAGTRTYRIEHSGRSGKFEEDVDIPIVNSIILIDGAGGHGGKG